MARSVNEEEYAARRKEILDAALQLVYTKGYDQMSIQDILNLSGISKGAFYHYFDSKGALLEALVEKTAEEIAPLLQAVVDEPNLTGPEKLQRYFDTAVRWKSGRREFMLELLRVWYSDENALVRQKIMASNLHTIRPLLTEIIRQGASEGFFTAPHPEHTYAMITYLMQGISDVMVEVLLVPEPPPDGVQRIREALAAYTDAIERLLGAAKGSFRLMDEAAIHEWFAVKTV